jgi:hypothetical protein
MKTLWKKWRERQGFIFQKIFQFRRISGVKKLRLRY